jgi:hypothetical protein
MYALANTIDDQRAIHHRLIEFGQDSLRLDCGVLWLDGRPMATPVVERDPADGLVLVDGLHRVLLAREQNRDAVTCVVVDGPSAPLVARACSWSDVQIIEQHELGTVQKRLYRFSSPAEVIQAFPTAAGRVNDENFRYFLYRDLDVMGSSGIRRPAGP